MIAAAFSGGKDSTAMVVRMAELGEVATLLFTPTGNELPEVRAHVDAIARLTGMPLVEPPGPTLDDMIGTFGALPNHRQRWCTRTIKIAPCIAWLKANPGAILCVGLRADEEEREGLYGAFASYRYPLREWGWGLKEVRSYCRDRGLGVPSRTDCALCYGQRLGEWYRLWRNHPTEFAKGGVRGGDRAHLPLRQARHVARPLGPATPPVRGRTSAQRWRGTARDARTALPGVPAVTAEKS